MQGFFLTSLEPAGSSGKTQLHGVKVTLAEDSIVRENSVATLQLNSRIVSCVRIVWPLCS